mmetsp:Transcript_4768/g.9083  ORF Transcript_4768/g.9083 Transcript_4768/m.9083 type:complete len:239 (-) Transcript_4768:88-804(-)
MANLFRVAFCCSIRGFQFLERIMRSGFTVVETLAHRLVQLLCIGRHNVFLGSVAWFGVRYQTAHNQQVILAFEHHRVRAAPFLGRHALHAGDSALFAVFGEEALPWLEVHGSHLLAEPRVAQRKGVVLGSEKAEGLVFFAVNRLVACCHFNKIVLAEAVREGGHGAEGLFARAVVNGEHFLANFKVAEVDCRDFVGHLIEHFHGGVFVEARPRSTRVVANRRPTRAAIRSVVTELPSG